MFFRKKKAKWNVVNDKDNNIVNLYLCVLNKYDDLIKNLFWLPKSRKIFLDFREEIKNEKEFKIQTQYKQLNTFTVLGIALTNLYIHLLLYPKT